MSFLKKKLENKNDIFYFPVTNSDTQKVTNFYKETPFPNYKENDDRRIQ